MRKLIENMAFGLLLLTFFVTTLPGSQKPDGSPFVTPSTIEIISVPEQAMVHIDGIKKGLTPHTYNYTLTVTDAFGETDSDEVSVTVEADTDAPELTLLGTGPFSTNIHIPYEDPGYEASDLCSDVTVDVSGTVDVETPGSYTLTYTATDEAGNASTTERIVTVINAAPVAAAGDDVAINCIIDDVAVNLDGSASTDPDGDALSYSWSLGGNVVSSTAAYTPSLGAGSHTFTLTVTDIYAASSSDNVLVEITADTEPPVITMLGDNPMELGLYLAYAEAGIEAEDACGSDVTIDISGSVDINIPASYTITYTATDEGGNASTAERVVEVVNTAPIVANAIDDFEISYGDDVLSADIDLLTVFSDADTSDVLSYSFTSSNGDAVTSSLTGSVLSFDVVDLGESFVEVTAVDPWEAEVSTSFVVTVNVTADLAGALLFAETKIDLKKDIEVFSGNIVINETHEHEQDGHNHDHEELKIDKDVTIAAGYKVMADGIKVKHNALIASDVYYNELENQGDITGDEYTFGDTPMFSTMPPFKSAPAGSQNIRVRKNQDLVLEPGDYHHIKVEDRGTLTFTGGVYNIEKLEAKKQSHIRFEEATEVRVEKELKIKKDVYVGPANGSYIDASDIIFYVDGNHHHNEDHHHHHHHHSVKMEDDVVFYGTIYAPESKVELKKKTAFTGAILAAEIKIDKEADLALDSYFGGSGAGLAKGGNGAWVEPEMAPEIPEVSSLASNYPNPFNPSTTIDFALDVSGDISLKIYDIRGAQVAEVAEGYYEAGHYSVHFTPENLSSGTYLYVLNAGSFREVKRMVYLK
ncbi:MAG: DUF5011 domain-containing protein [Candidatus Marinimicrobia bacterium]|nr:DUF5011 domain-containing protein [Candidatus Neomarinimicrobiota bacterium]MBT6010016.1 DUF5011 domain-containing protein [Candidatus Neomarinimicrobiota bacterium]